MESELYKAAMRGNVHSLRELLTKDKLLLDKIMIGNHIESPLHIAAMLGHLEFVKEVLAQKVELAMEQDSQGSTPLHLAAAKGYLKIVASLLRVNPETCFVCDKYERNPLHVAAMKGHMDVLKLLVRERPDAARAVVEHGQTILHLCVKHNRMEALKFLMDNLGDDQFKNLQDEYGDSILHLAAANKQIKTIVFLIDKGVNLKIKNFKDFTALGLLAQGESAGRASEIKVSVPQTLENHDPPERSVYGNNTITAFHPPIGEEDKREIKEKWQASMHKTLMVVATLLATMSFQVGITPPGGLWQDDISSNGTMHVAGESIMADKYPSSYKRFVIYNTMTFVSSLGIIMLLISGIPLKRRRITTWIVMLIMWVAISFAAATYAISIAVFTPPTQLNTFVYTIGVAVLAWVGFIALLFLWHVVRLIQKLVRKILKYIRKASTEGKLEDLMV
ncbi:hypothetical protein BT93_L3413 [Corymbia citriodora subsp. variegata]|uniref:PGG domain-containing protein n=1 Tax=Corymbia citriodora subsp. variegata TaxID=360336 RepID=A0A8T0CMK0_CORYI|nr:hypothetical protein BT93_L3413 [Corymbia citriodora subsp. variegata]